jgi:hypothetical protein
MIYANLEFHLLGQPSWLCFGHLQEAENMMKGMTSKPYVKGFAQGLQNPHCDVKMGEHFTK